MQFVCLNWIALRGCWVRDEWPEMSGVLVSDFGGRKWSFK